MSIYKEKYKWLRTIDLFTGEIDLELDPLDDIPEGWVKAFGEFMCEELDVAIKAAGIEDEYVVDQVKEKYGEMRWYDRPSNQEISDIVEKYSVLSRNICVHCGKPDVNMLTKTSWILPMCKCCYEKYSNYKRPYEDVIGEENRMADTLEYTQHYRDENGKFVKKEVKIDIRETAELIRKRWETQQNNKEM